MDNHKRGFGATVMLEHGCTLGEIEDRYQLWSGTIPAKLRYLDNTFCFTMPYLQGCDKPAYRLSRISGSGDLYVFGIGSFMGGYESHVRWNELRESKPLSELYIYPLKGN
jgi:hypothetical protein